VRVGARPLALLALGLGLFVPASAATRSGAQHLSEGVPSPTELSDGGTDPHETQPGAAKGEMDQITKAAKAECQAMEARLCHERGMALLDVDGGTEFGRGATMVREACTRGYAPSCAATTMTPPVAIEPAMPKYTKAAREREVEGTVLVKCLLPVDGHPRDCVILKSLPWMDEAVLAALAVSRYEPVTYLGRAYATHYVFKFQFKLH
jgi:TonB family protein